MGKHIKRELAVLNQNVVDCTRCSRLIPYIDQVAKDKVKRFRDHTYWGKPVPGFGDHKAQFLIIGLAPAAHGANRTGRMFTGDSSGDWLFRALHEAGFANQAESTAATDGLKLTNCFITSLAHCAPPQNKPTTEEIKICSNTHLTAYLDYFKNVKVVLCLGGLSFNWFCRIRGIKGMKFMHHGKFEITDKQLLMSSYHPSRQNTNTGRLKWNDWVNVFLDIRTHLNQSN